MQAAKSPALYNNTRRNDTELARAGGREGAVLACAGGVAGLTIVGA
jgi:hypothetical protein